MVALINKLYKLAMQFETNIRALTKNSEDDWFHNCKSCGASNHWNLNNCEECGKPMHWTAEEELERDEAQKRYLKEVEIPRIEKNVLHKLLFPKHKSRVQKYFEDLDQEKKYKLNVDDGL